MALRLSASHMHNIPRGIFGQSLLPPLHQAWTQHISRPFTIVLPWSTQDIWEWVLKAVPKKRTSYSKKRSRQMAGKALKDVTAMNNCAGCGRVKRAHTLCVYCMFDIKTLWKNPSLLPDTITSMMAKPAKLDLAQSVKTKAKPAQDVQKAVAKDEAKPEKVQGPHAGL